MATPNGAAPSPQPTNGVNYATQHASPDRPTNLTTANPQTSLQDTGVSRRPRDARLIHLILANQGVTAYQERVPLQLLDYAYRYTSGILQDSLHLSAEGYGQSNSGSGSRGVGSGGSGGEGGNISLAALKLSISSKLAYQHQSAMPKEFLISKANEKNKVALPTPRGEYGIRLPHERYCLTGVGYGLREEWESEEEFVEGSKEAEGVKDEDEEMGEDVEGGTAEDLFGEGDRNMEET